MLFEHVYSKVLFMKITVDSDYTLTDLKKAFRIHYGYPKSHKVLKSDIAKFIINEVDAIIMDILHGNDDE